MKLVVGLGNPGRKYAETRHNVGFQVVGELAHRYGQGKPRAKFRGEVVDANIEGARAVLLAPHTYMNRSGVSVLAARDFYKVPHGELLVICDDFQLPLGRLRIRPKGSAGGQKGLQDIIRRLGTQEFPRLRLGIGSPPPQWDVADYVLSKFERQEQEIVRQSVMRAADAVAVWVGEGVERCMSQFNAG